MYTITVHQSLCVFDIMTAGVGMMHVFVEIISSKQLNKKAFYKPVQMTLQRLYRNQHCEICTTWTVTVLYLNSINISDGRKKAFFYLSLILSAESLDADYTPCSLQETMG